MTIGHFPGCAKSAVLIPNKPMKQHNVIQALKLASEVALRHKDIHLFKSQDSDLAQPRKHYIVTRPFSS